MRRTVAVGIALVAPVGVAQAAGAAPGVAPASRLVAPRGPAALGPRGKRDRLLERRRLHRGCGVAVRRERLDRAKPVRISSAVVGRHRHGHIDSRACRPHLLWSRRQVAPVGTTALAARRCDRCRTRRAPWLVRLPVLAMAAAAGLPVAWDGHPRREEVAVADSGLTLRWKRGGGHSEMTVERRQRSHQCAWRRARTGIETPLVNHPHELYGHVEPAVSNVGAPFWRACGLSRKPCAWTPARIDVRSSVRIIVEPIGGCGVRRRVPWPGRAGAWLSLIGRV